MASSVESADGSFREALEYGHPHLWVVDVTDLAFLALGDAGGSGEGLWSESDRERAAALADPEARRRLLARRAALRVLLADYAECRPEAVRVVTAPGGKPVSVPAESSGPLVPPFSVGHSGSLFCIGVASGGSVGCDVETLRAVPRAQAIADRWFGPEEAESIASSAEDADTAFIEMWTCKEALAKRHGAGLRLMMGQASEPEVRRELDVSAEQKAGRLRGFEPAEGYLGAMACTDPIYGIEIFRPDERTWII